MDVKTNGNISFWYADIGGLPQKRSPLPGDRTADVCIIGAGYTGLWTAYYLKKANPSLDIVVVEREFAGFGASGRNGGWLSGGFGWSREKYLKTSTRGAVVDMQRAMAGTVDEVIRVAETEGIDADILRADNLTVATNQPQLDRAREEYQFYLDWEMPPEQIEMLSAEEAARRIRIANVKGGFVIRDMARVQPAKLVRGLAAVVERLGVPIFEGTAVTAFEKGRVTTDRGTVLAPVIIRATEGFTAGLPGEERTWLPLNSAQIVTEPVPDALWEQIGWEGHELLGDAAHAYCYAQRTREGRITMGGRGVPYRFGSKTDINGQTQQATIEALHAILTRLLPQTKSLRIDHAWCGVLGVPRDWCTTAGFDRQTGIGWAGGYVGLGVSSSNLAGRTLADLVLGRETALTGLPWVNRTVRKWEPEPFRWLGVHSMYQLYRIADEREFAGLAQTSRLAAIADAITGH
ncbi:FAD-dependent oxidoreductase [Shinella sumterensis]|uniref:NAD(P)/FAD-dependent oxidoreductase n=1 Tax=Shinella sumterensis TaxID=1967501 RepID=UPI00106E742A|nr:FAD-binding oxidoreductase [Shinella sumterensis]MCD1262398.1 FAD-dependent oxidoreductase [Shinella sumterensis]TFE99921.1 FAD-dependent oxidoreductase [Shinella sumterensis]